MNSYLYALENTINGKKYIGVKTERGKDIRDYVSSSNNPELEKAYNEGEINRLIIFKGEEDEARAAEYFALKYMFGTLPQEKFYNLSFNASKGSDIDTKLKAKIVNYIDGNPLDETIDLASCSNTIARKIRDSVKAGEYITTWVDINKVLTYGKSQVRQEQYGKVQEIVGKIKSDPVKAKETMSGITVAVMKDGKNIILDGNTRLRAATLVGWEKVPAIYIDVEEFGDPKRLRRTFSLYGSFSNDQDFVVTSPNTAGDIRGVILELLEENEEYFVYPIKDKRGQSERIEYICAQLHGLQGFKPKVQAKNAIQSIIDQDEITKYTNKKLIKRTDNEVLKYAVHKYELNNIPFVKAKVSKYKEVGWYALRHEKEQAKKKHTKPTKAAIVLYYSSVEEYIKATREGWVEDIIETIEHHNLQDDIIVEVLPAFEDAA